MYEAVEEMHTFGIIHSNITWGKVMFRETKLNDKPNYTAVLIDFDSTSQSEHF